MTNVRWTPDDKTLLSTGGMDATLLVWERINIGPEGISIYSAYVNIVTWFQFLPVVSTDVDRKMYRRSKKSRFSDNNIISISVFFLIVLFRYSVLCKPLLSRFSS